MTERALSSSYRKTVFTWTPDFGLSGFSAGLQFVDLTSPDDARLADIVRRVLADSGDPADIALVSKHGENAAATFLAAAAADFAFQIGWWQLACDTDGDCVGFHLPVVYRDSKRDGLDEGTIYYLGVVREHRGRGYGAAITEQSTRIFSRIGVWRVYCDTWDKNEPMKAAFRRAGYREGGTRAVGMR